MEKIFYDYREKIYLNYSKNLNEITTIINPEKWSYSECFDSFNNIIECENINDFKIKIIEKIKKKYNISFDLNLINDSPITFDIWLDKGEDQLKIINITIWGTTPNLNMRG